MNPPPYDNLTADELKIVYAFQLDARRERAARLLQGAQDDAAITRYHWQTILAIQNIRALVAQAQGALGAIYHAN